MPAAAPASFDRRTGLDDGVARFWGRCTGYVPLRPDGREKAMSLVDTVTAAADRPAAAVNASPPHPICVLLCDDHPLVRQALQQAVADADDIRLAGEATQGSEVLRRVREAGGAIDVVLMDIAMPYRDGLDLLRQLRAEGPRLPVLMLSTYPDKQYAVRSLKLGAVGCLDKSADSARLAAAIRQVAAGGLYITPGVGERPAPALDHRGRMPLREQLPPHEYQVFRLLTAGSTLAEIAEQLGMTAQSVAGCRARLLQAAGVRNDVELTLYAMRETLA